MQQLLGSVLRGLQVEQLLVLVDELGVHGGVEELVVGQDVLQERDVGLHVERGAKFGHFTHKIIKITLPPPPTQLKLLREHQSENRKQIGVNWTIFLLFSSGSRALTWAECP